MSLLILKDNSGINLFNEIIQEDAQAKQNELISHKINFLNSCDKCLVCDGEPTIDEDTHLIQPLIKHHVRYFPQVISYVHYECHKKIHDTENPIKSLIQYEEGDSEEFYNLRKQSMMGGMV